ncbi:OLC1v1011990C1 [Oldenlandia corymbosa var. corymbosa]|uniref:OLC1v1011990C1 n=1 Tax=Oldenlandia corymbosa var. corymbosa TaxID=529605 RepID=A0AAV1DV05_OLDCO|nr:OLC1v1011990C1 [Oldenlandia corymbosa var. corymbosa]
MFLTASKFLLFNNMYLQLVVFPFFCLIKFLEVNAVFIIVIIERLIYQQCFFLLTCFVVIRFFTSASILGRRLSKLEMLKRRGKGPPKKGQGKKAAKRNKVSSK